MQSKGNGWGEKEGEGGEKEGGGGGGTLQFKKTRRDILSKAI